MVRKANAGKYDPTTTQLVLLLDEVAQSVAQPSEVSRGEFNKLSDKVDRLKSKVDGR